MVGLALLGLISPLLAACGGENTATAIPPTAMPSTPVTSASDVTPTAMSNTGKPTIVVASKDFTEEVLVGEMYAELLEKAGYTVKRQLNLGSTKIVQPALVKGDVQLYPEYTGTGLIVVLGKPTMGDPKAVYDTVKSEYETQFQLTWLDPAPMNDTQAIATTKALADKYGLKTLSDLSTKAPELRFTCAAEFLGRDDGLPGLQKAYGGFQFKDVKTVDIALKYKALLAGDADVTEAFSTDGAIAGNDLVVLQDDKHFFPAYQIAPVIRDDVLKANPDIAGVLNVLAPKLTDSAVAAINWEVDGKKREPADVAKEFLQQNGLLP
jgi:osmoprotectant transport system substrate-binding protein